MSAKLQLALDFVELEEALALLEKVQCFVDIIEIGTPTIIRYGVEAVRRVKQSFPQKLVLADLKIMDAGEGEARLAFEAGADLVTVLAVAHDETILGAVRAAAKFRGQIMADLMSAFAPARRAQEVEQLGCNILCVHTATDAPETGGQAFQIVRLLRTQVSKAQIAVAGGIDIRSANGACESGADILVVGGAILKAKDQREAARALHQVCAGHVRR
jgi:3-hexulose-6-phosphate synthase